MGSKMPKGTKTTMFPTRFLMAMAGMLLKRDSWEEMVLKGTKLLFHAPCSLFHLTESIFSIIEFIDRLNLNNNRTVSRIQYTINILLITFITMAPMSISMANFK